jgi:hypothetical protein
MSMHRKWIRRAGGLAVIGLVCAVSALAATSASARPPSSYQDWAQTTNNGAGVKFHPYGDYFEVWGNKRGDEPYAVSVEYNYKGVQDGWKTVYREILIGQHHVKFRHNLREHTRIFFRILGPDGDSPISEYRTT